jgi:hypothetical protein
MASRTNWSRQKKSHLQGERIQKLSNWDHESTRTACGNRNSSACQFCVATNFEGQGPGARGTRGEQQSTMPGIQGYQIGGWITQTYHMFQLLNDDAFLGNWANLSYFDNPNLAAPPTALGAELISDKKWLCDFENRYSWRGLDDVIRSRITSTT